MTELIRVAVLGAIGWSSASVAATSPVSPVDAFITQHLQTSTYEKAEVDLNADGVKETVVYSSDPDQCGSGGCSLFVLTPYRGGFRIVMDASVTRSPIRQLPTRSHGWRDIGVVVAGGGILPGHDVRLRFDGTIYPSNPTVPPAEAVTHPGGRILFAR